MATKKSASESQPEAALVEFYNRNGYMRVPDVDRQEEDPHGYKKGCEIRLLAKTQRELRTIRRLLRQVGIKSGKPFLKANQWCQPVYGKQSMALFKKWLKKYAR